MRDRSVAPRATVVLLAALAAACARDSSGTEQRGAAPPAPYRVVDVGHGGAVAGVVRLTTHVRADTVVHYVADRGVCGDSAIVHVVESTGGGLGEVVVWLDDARAGKPLPASRRYDLTHQNCLIEPRVQGALVGGTVDVLDQDAAEHRARFLRAGTDSTIDVVRETGEWQMVPTEQVLARPGPIEVRCDRHPATRAWLWAFDQPYFTVTGADGRFVLDSVPPGRYHLVAWHPALGRREADVEVSAGHLAARDLAF